MSTSAARTSIAAPDEHILTVQEALEPLFLALEEEAEIKMIAAAVKAAVEESRGRPLFDLRAERL